MPTGRKPKPLALKRAEGNPGNRKLNENEPVPPPGQVLAPPWLKGEALRFFRDDLVPIMLSMGVATVADVPAIARYCDHLVQWTRAAAWIEEHGVKYPVRSNAPGHEVLGFKTFPEVSIYRNLSRLLITFEAEFGLTASSRSRIQVREPTKGHGNTAKDDEFFAGPRLAAG